MRQNREIIRKYDKDNNLIYRKFSDGWEGWFENNKLIHSVNSTGDKTWYKYNINNERIEITEQEYKKIKKRNCFTRFEIMEI